MTKTTEIPCLHCEIGDLLKDYRELFPGYSTAAMVTQIVRATIEAIGPEPIELREHLYRLCSSSFEAMAMDDVKTIAEEFYKKKPTPILEACVKHAAQQFEETLAAQKRAMEAIEAMHEQAEALAAMPAVGGVQ